MIYLYLRFDGDISTHVKIIQSSQLSEPFNLMNVIRQDASVTASDHTSYVSV